jgi:hypothetical protein
MLEQGAQPPERRKGSADTRKNSARTDVGKRSAATVPESHWRVPEYCARRFELHQSESLRIESDG